MVKDRDKKTDETDASTRATSVGSEIGTIHLFFHKDEDQVPFACYQIWEQVSSES